MATVTGPNLSLKSSGTVAKTLTHTTWRGVNVVRSYASPSNPNTTEQQKTRSSFSALCAIWKGLSAAVQAVWTLAAKGQPYTDRNYFISVNNSALRTATDMTGIMISNGAKGGIVPDGITVTGAAGKLTVTGTAPALPTGWTVTAYHAVAIKAQDPHAGDFDATTVYGTDVSAPYSIDLTVPAGSYVVYGFFGFTKPDGSIAYGASIAATGTAS